MIHLATRLATALALALVLVVPLELATDGITPAHADLTPDETGAIHPETNDERMCVNYPETCGGPTTIDPAWITALATCTSQPGATVPSYRVEIGLFTAEQLTIAGCTWPADVHPPTGTPVITDSPIAPTDTTSPDTYEVDPQPATATDPNLEPVDQPTPTPASPAAGILDARAHEPVVLELSAPVLTAVAVADVMRMVVA